MGQTKIRQAQISGGNDGWIPAEETWTYASADDPTYTFTITGDKTSKYSVGMKLKLTQTTAKYFIITQISYGSPNTTVTIYGGTDYDLANAAITSPYYSYVKSPQGFPMSPSKWQVILTDTTQRLQLTPTANTWYNPGSLTITIPIGSWDIKMKFAAVASLDATAIGSEFALSSSASSVSDANFYCRAVGVGRATTIPFSYDGLVLASKTAYYPIVRTTTNSVSSIGFYNDIVNMWIAATCNYL